MSITVLMNIRVKDYATILSTDAPAAHVENKCIHFKDRITYKAFFEVEFEVQYSNISYTSMTILAVSWEEKQTCKNSKWSKVTETVAMVSGKGSIKAQKFSELNMSTVQR